MARQTRVGLLLWFVATAACEKLPLVDIQAGFTLADAAWFSQEETLFVFYRVSAEQGLGPETQVELTYHTDDVAVDWTPLEALPMVHAHQPVDCGANGRCGSASVRVVKMPREVGVRLRYHRDGEMTLPSTVTFNVVGPGPAATHRSLAVYGVFDESNTRVQWRARHQFPTLRNEQVQELGLRRVFRIEEPQYGTLPPLPAQTPYGYAFDEACPVASTTPLGWGPAETYDRAVFAPESLPLEASTAPSVCGRSVVTDARGTFAAPAVARKNPVVRPGFPALRSPIREHTPVGFLLRPCQRTISEPHQVMQAQRLLLDQPVEVCLDDWRAPSFPNALAGRLRARLDEVRAQGKDMILTLALHHDDGSGGLAGVLEQVLESILSRERDKGTPRVSGAFVFDSVAHTVRRPGLRRLVLWCPANLPQDDLEQIPTEAQRSCPLLPDIPDIRLGPFKFNNLPILPTRAQYLTFLSKYSEGQAGRMKSLRFLAPERTAFSENLAAGDFATVTFFNQEQLSAASGDAFSFCTTEDKRASLVVFRTSLSPDPLPLQALPEVHRLAPQSTYALGLAWDFPFLTRAQYEVVLAGAASAFSLSVPFGISGSNEAYYGAALWEAGEFPLAETLTQCTRFCDHPTFDAAGAYGVSALFRASYGGQCYRPKYPVPGDGGFPLDP